VSASGRPDLRPLVEVPNYLGSRPVTAQPIRGTTVSGEPVVHELTEGTTLLMFLSTSCDGCQELWEAFGDAGHPAFPATLSRLVVTRRSTEDPGKAAGQAGSATVVMSDEAWADYAVHSGPFFVLVDGAGSRILTEGVAWSVDQITAAVAAAWPA
jgi:hypothetical protein